MLRYNQFIKENVEDHAGIIKDVFQDIFDEWDIYLGVMGEGSGLFYNITTTGGLSVLDIWSESEGCYQQSHVIENLKLSPYINKLRNMGYTVRNKTERWVGDFDDCRSDLLSGKHPIAGKTRNISLWISHPK